MVFGRNYSTQQKKKDGTPLDWGIVIPKIVSGHRQKSRDYWKKLKNQDVLYARIALIGQLRNRIAHFEPIWKMGPQLEETRKRQNKEPNVLKPAPINKQESLERLIDLHKKAQEFLGWMSQSSLKSYKKSYIFNRLEYLLTLEGLNNYSHLQN